MGTLTIVVAALNVFSFLAVLRDKQLASKHAGKNSRTDKSFQRISELDLIVYSALGGALGTLIAFFVFRHKMATGKSYLRNRIYLMLLLNIVLFTSLYLNL